MRRKAVSGAPGPNHPAAGGLPPRLHGVTGVYSVTVECRLGHGTGPVDFAWSQSREDFAVPPVLAQFEPWVSMARFAERWRLHLHDLLKTTLELAAWRGRSFSLRS